MNQFRISDETYSSRGRFSEGPREACEDTVCNAICAGSRTSVSAYKSCKQQCFKDKKTEIVSCCQNFCQNSACVDACEEPLVYGGTTIDIGVGDDGDWTIDGGDITSIRKRIGKWIKVDGEWVYVFINSDGTVSEPEDPKDVNPLRSVPVSDLPTCTIL